MHGAGVVGVSERVRKRVQLVKRVVDVIVHLPEIFLKLDYNSSRFRLLTIDTVI